MFCFIININITNSVSNNLIPNRTTIYNLKIDENTKFISLKGTTENGLPINFDIDDLFSIDVRKISKMRRICFRKMVRKSL